MPSAYGYIKGTMGADDMQVDCYIGKHPESKNIWIIDQDKFDEEGRDKGFDEHKVMLGYKTPEKAMKAYLKSHYDGQGHERMAAVTEVNYDELKDWLKNGDTTRPISEQGYGHVVARRGVNKADTISTGTGLLWYDQTLATRRQKSEEDDLPQGAAKTSPRKRKKKKVRRGRTLRSGPRWLTLKTGVM
jgi:hypothetical protein